MENCEHSKARAVTLPPEEVLLYRYDSGDCTDARNYDVVRYTSLIGRYKQQTMRRVYLPMLGSLHNKTVLDVACGTGRGAIDLAGKARKVVAVDGSTDMLSVMRKKLNDPKDVTLVAGFAQRLPFSDDTFDLVVSLNFLHLFRPGTQRAFVDEMIRVLKPGGFLLLEFDNALHAFGAGMLRRWLGGERGSRMSEIRGVISQCASIVRVRGALIPVLWRVFGHCPRIGGLLERVASLPFLNRVICLRLYVGAKKSYGA